MRKFTNEILTHLSDKGFSVPGVLSKILFNLKFTNETHSNYFPIFFFFSNSLIVEGWYTYQSNLLIGAMSYQSISAEVWLTI